MPTDRSRPPEPTNWYGGNVYTGVAFQQGRVTLDRDYTAMREILDAREAALVSSLFGFGGCGTLDGGFAISHFFEFENAPRREAGDLQAARPAEALIQPLSAAARPTAAGLRAAPVQPLVAERARPATALSGASPGLSTASLVGLQNRALRGGGVVTGGVINRGLPPLSGLVGSPPVAPAATAAGAPQPYDLRIGGGSMYLGGMRIQWTGVTGGFFYSDQPNWLTPDPPPAQQTELVYLLVSEQEVSAAEDPDLYDVALGGPDTTQRVWLQSTVRRQAVATSDPQTGWEDVLQTWQQSGWELGYLEYSQLDPAAVLQASYAAPATTAGPCDPIAAGGYLGAENQLIRVKLIAPQTTGADNGLLIWGFDNASFVYRASCDPTGTILTLTRSPPDAAHFPGAGQYVEVLRTNVLLTTAQPTDGINTLPQRCVAEETGFVTTLAIAYDPTTSNQSLVLSTPLPDAYATSGAPLFVRIWQGGGPLAGAGGTLELIDPVANASTGITVTVQTTFGQIPNGAYWMMALRPGTPQTLQPTALLAAPQTPDGPRTWICPLALIEWSDGTWPIIHDMRVIAENLVALTQRPLGCCTAYMSPYTVTVDKTLQTAINGLYQAGTLCLAPGDYELTAPLLIGPNNAGLTIDAANGATISVAPGSEAAFGQGLIVVAGAPGVTLRGLTLQPSIVAMPADLLANLTNLSRIALPEMEPGFSALLQQIEATPGTITTSIGVWAAGSPSLTLDRCTITFNDTPQAAGQLVAIGLLAGSACSKLVVSDCTFSGGILQATQSAGLTQASGLLGPSGFDLANQLSTGLQAVFGVLACPYVAQFLSPVATQQATPRPVVPIPIRQLPPLERQFSAPSAETVTGATSTVRTPAATSPLAAAIQPKTAGIAQASVLGSANARESIAGAEIAKTGIAQAGIAQAGIAQTGIAQAGIAQTGITRTGIAQTGITTGILRTAPTQVVSNAPPSLDIVQPINSNLLNRTPGALGVPNLGAQDLDLSDQFTAVLDLTGAIFTGNVFDSLTVAISAFGMLDQVRVADNTVVNSGGGIWLRPIEAPAFSFDTSGIGVNGAPDPAVFGDTMWLKLVLQQQETLLGWLLGILLPLPGGALYPVFAAPQGGLSLTVAGNHVAALAGAITGATPGGTPALAVVTGLFGDQVDLGPGLVMANNRLQARTPPPYPAAVLAMSGRMTVTGNLISNESGGSPPTNASLQIFPQNNGFMLQGAVEATNLCVTGNVLEGASNLASLMRTDAAGTGALETWLPFNASS